MIPEVKVQQVCSTISEFALEYRTCRERVLQQIQKKANHRERNKTRGKMIMEVKRVTPILLSFLYLKKKKGFLSFIRASPHRFAEVIILLYSFVDFFVLSRERMTISGLFQQLYKMVMLSRHMLIYVGCTLFHISFHLIILSAGDWLQSKWNPQALLEESIGTVLTKLWMC